MLLSLFLTGLVMAVSSACAQDQTGQHTDWPRWCGKVYKPGYANYNPGGHTASPASTSKASLLFVQLAPRFSLYLDSESEGQLVIRTSLSSNLGNQFPANANGKRPTVAQSSSPRYLHFNVSLSDGSRQLASGSALLDATGDDNVVSFSLQGLQSGLQPQGISLTGYLESPDKSSRTTFTADSQLLYLPDKSTGSTTRIDNLNGGFFFRRNADPSAGFQPFFPYGYFASDDGFLTGVTDDSSADSVMGSYSAYGLNAMAPLVHVTEKSPVFSYLESHDLRFQYDLRENYTNLDWVTEQVRAVRDNAALFAYWSADEPDGKQDPFEWPVNAYNSIRANDPYHPVAVVLNCDDYYFDQYSTGADIIMEDVYPIGINIASSKWGTVCNETYGDCGCDNCFDGDLAIFNVRDRLSDYANYEKALGRWPKIKAHNPQTFSGEGYWSRDPTAQEEWATSVVAINNGAKALMSWLYPAPDALSAAHSQLAKVLTQSPVLDYLVGNSQGAHLYVSSNSMDAVAWTMGSGADYRVLVTVVNGGYAATDDVAAIPIDTLNVSQVDSVLWGDVSWHIVNDELRSIGNVNGLATSFVVLR